jgi:flagellar FliJ protein
MAKFKYKFESVLNVKIIMEKKIQEEISLIEKEIKEYNHKRQIVIEERNRTRQSLKEIHCRVSEYLSAKIFDMNLSKVIKTIENKIEVLNESKVSKQMELVEKKKERKVFETLKDSQLQEYLIDERRNELKELNEIAIRNFNGIEW